MDASEGESWKEEIRIAQWWRALLGDQRYQNYMPADLIRWYRDLELRGPIEIRALLRQSGERRPQAIVRGVSWQTPDPPRDLVDLWLSSHDQHINLTPVWYGLVAFFLFTIVTAQILSGCGQWNNQANSLPFEKVTPGTEAPQPMTSQSMGTLPTAPALSLPGRTVPISPPASLSTSPSAPSQGTAPPSPASGPSGAGLSGSPGGG